MIITVFEKKEGEKARHVFTSIYKYKQRQLTNPILQLHKQRERERERERDLLIDMEFVIDASTEVGRQEHTR